MSRFGWVVSDTHRLLYLQQRMVTRCCSETGSCNGSVPSTLPLLEPEVHRRYRTLPYLCGKPKKEATIVASEVVLVELGSLEHLAVSRMDTRFLTFLLQKVTHKVTRTNAVDVSSHPLGPASAFERPQSRQQSRGPASANDPNAVKVGKDSDATKPPFGRPCWKFDPTRTAAVGLPAGAAVPQAGL